MLDNLDRSISIRCLSSALGVSERTLRYAFHEAFGTSPVQYLKTLRLHRARGALRQANSKRTTVRREALRSGFWHLSRFSAEYKDYFGELPSVTLKSQPAERAGVEQSGRRHQRSFRSEPTSSKPTNYNNRLDKLNKSWELASEALS